MKNGAESIEEIKKTVFSRNPSSIKYKSEFYELFNNGFFGNKADTAISYEEVIKKGWKGTVSIRSRGNGTARALVYNFPIENIPDEIEKRRKLGFDVTKLSFSLTPPDDKLRIQGEIMRTEQGIFVLYSTVKKPMNLSLRDEEKIATGICAQKLLEENLFPVSLDDIYEILELFPNDVIEFSSYDVCVGNLPHRNTIIWEVRGY
ncbi:Uncharacterised protein [uncultured archaeon]|nr:Uncharacterised protein [uncultured archaeon]